MLAQQDTVFMETCETIYQKNQDDVARLWCEASEEAARVARTIQKKHEKALDEREAVIVKQETRLAEQEKKLAEQEKKLAEQEKKLAEKDAELERMRRLLAETNGQH